MVEYEFRDVHLPRGTTRSAALRMLTDAAEYEHWELVYVRLYPDGRRKILLRRRIIRAVRTA